ncbi:c-type cytochrome [Halomonas sp. McH1-25]|nr:MULTISPECIES: c-type cytochrome [unclassified Halomonas]MCG7599859.1 c-type cytochrome [Halomonas sp. McH1-25]MCP1343051.1 c-type cytochrome [Halomonas sp. FL8]MCP1361581.1 c-type cytochrome [Halomonas sp. BBD45]MCP1365343.1 c-type cytochrome [Halomonas sp. BBD48]
MKSFVAILSVGSVLAMSSTAFAVDGETLFKTKACAACHAIDAKMVGPAYTDVAAKYDGQDDAVAILVDSILHGSQGKWGPIPMPPNPSVTEEEANTLAEWILEQ